MLAETIFKEFQNCEFDIQAIEKIIESNKYQKDEFDIEAMKIYMALSVRQKLEHLEKLNEFLRKITPQTSKIIWEQIKEWDF